MSSLLHRFRWGLVLAMLSLAAPLAAQPVVDTLRHLPPDAPLTAYAATGAGAWGYATGHNNRLTEEYAEKYTVNGAARLIGVVGHFTGTLVTPTRSVQIRAHAVGTNQLPGGLLGTRTVTVGSLDLSGGPSTVLFTQPVAVANAFFVSFNLGDYAHSSTGGNVLAVMSGLDGSREEQPLPVFGQNAVRRHSHGSAVWVDLATQHHFPLSTHLALFPIVEFLTSSTEGGAVASRGLRLFAPAPNPAVLSTTVSYEIDRPREVLVDVYDLLGRPVLSLDHGQRPAGRHEAHLDLSSLAPGTYVCMVRAGAARLGVRLTVSR